MNRISKQLTALALGLLMTTAVVTQAAAETGQTERSSHGERMARYLALDDNQRESMRAAYQVYGPELRQLRQEMREQRGLLRQASQGEFNEGQVRAASVRLGELSAERSFQRARLGYEIRQVLSEEQVAKLEQRRGKGKGQGRGYQRRQR
ncbi:MAG: periplasmic heavy metal sensor [Halomonadaceae bacterium]|nr:MAG: periplasmic heavy metal sensor [Halomonadaceae bacterium]